MCSTTRSQLQTAFLNLPRSPGMRETAQGMKTADIPFALIADHFRPMAEAVRQGSAQ